MKRIMLIAAFVAGVGLAFCLVAVAHPTTAHPLRGYEIRLDGLTKASGGISSRYVITNLGDGTAGTSHGYYEVDHDWVPFSHFAYIGEGKAETFDLADIRIPDGQYYVIVSADQPITGTVLPPSYEPVVAAFTAYPPQGVEPLVVTFVSEATGECDSFHWDFGDGFTSTVENPVHTYAHAGDYTVSLRVSGLGGSDEETKTAYIHVLYGVYLPSVLR